MEIQEDELRAALVKATADYHETATADVVSQSALAEKSKKIKELRSQLSEWLGKDAIVCPMCNRRPTAHLKALIPANVEKQKEEQRTYEIVCAECLVRSRGATIRAATLLWNAGEYVKG